MAVFGSGGGTKVGSIVIGSTQAMDGFLLCDGSTISRTLYADLFAVIGTQYGAGDGSTTFRLPNLNANLPLGSTAAVVGNGRVLAFTNSSAVCALSAFNGQYQTMPTTGAYNANYPGGQNPNGVANGTFGVPTLAQLGNDATKSGIVADLTKASNAVTIKFYIKY